MVVSLSTRVTCSALRAASASRSNELTKHISLAQLDPAALLKLRQNGECFMELPEMAFDMDYPGHYFRRLKSVGRVARPADAPVIAEILAEAFDGYRAWRHFGSWRRAREESSSALAGARSAPAGHPGLEIEGA